MLSPNKHSPLVLPALAPMVRAVAVAAVAAVTVAAARDARGRAGNLRLPVSCPYPSPAATPSSLASISDTSRGVAGSNELVSVTVPARRVVLAAAVAAAAAAFLGDPVTVRPVPFLPLPPGVDADKLPEEDGVRARRPAKLLLSLFGASANGKGDASQVDLDVPEEEAVLCRNRLAGGALLRLPGVVGVVVSPRVVVRLGDGVAVPEGAWYVNSRAI